MDNTKKGPGARIALSLILALTAASPASAAEPPSGGGVAISPMEEQRAANIQTALAFNTAILDGDIAAVRRLIGPSYKEHDPDRRDGLAGIELAIELERMEHHRQTMAYQLVLGDGDLVAVLGQLTTAPLSRGPGAPPVTPGKGAAPSPAISTAGVPAGGPLIGPSIPQGALITTEQRAELFRISDGKVVEHWITIQNRGNP